MRQGQQPFSGAVRPTGSVIFGEEFESGIGAYAAFLPGQPMPRGFGLQQLPAQLQAWNPGGELPANLPAPWLDPAKQIGGCYAATPPGLKVWEWAGAIGHMSWPAGQQAGDQGIVSVGDIYGRPIFPALPFNGVTLDGIDLEYRNGIILSADDLRNNADGNFLSAGVIYRFTNGVLVQSVYAAKWASHENIGTEVVIECGSNPMVRFLCFYLADANITIVLVMYSDDDGLGWRLIVQYALSGPPQTIGFGCTGKQEAGGDPPFNGPASGGAEYMRAFALPFVGAPGDAGEDNLNALLNYLVSTGRSPDGGRNWPGII